ncbi:MAG TPA: histidine phosphatase family protein [Terrimesophilobacter sp.]|nr:histidine phosphatase family protein [Terrimesophilobacter sp.]
MRLLLIRHGQTPGNVLGQLDTAYPGPGLTALGLEQAAGLAAALKDQPIDALYASTLLRTQLTAEPLSRTRGLEVGVRPGLHEIEAGSLESRSDRDSIRQYLETVYAWGLGDLGTAMPGGPDGHAFFGRFDEDIAAIAGSGAQAAAVVSHGAAIRVWVSSRARNISPSFGAENPLDNTGIVVLDGGPTEGWTLTTWAGTPVGGPDLVDEDAEDPTGETLSEAVESAPELSRDSQ